MSDFHSHLEREARRVSAADGALTAVRRRAERNRRSRRILSGAVAVAIASAGFAFALVTFGGPSRDKPSAGPSATPTPSLFAYPEEYPPRLQRVNVFNATNDELLDEYAAARLVGADFLAQPGGNVLDSSGEVSQRRITEIRYEKPSERRAFRIQNQIFPGARMTEVTDADAGIVVQVGADFLTNEGHNIAPFKTVFEFMLARAREESVESFLSPQAASQYERGARGLHVYDSTARQREWALVAATPLEDGLQVVAEILLRHNGWQEYLLVEPRPETAESFWITDAHVEYKFAIGESTAGS